MLSPVMVWQSGLSVLVFPSFWHCKSRVNSVELYLEIMREVTYRYGIGVAQRALGRIAQARFEGGRIHLALAELAHAQGHRDTLARHLRAAYDLFEILYAHKYIGRTIQLLQAFQIP